MSQTEILKTIPSLIGEMAFSFKIYLLCNNISFINQILLLLLLVYELNYTIAYLGLYII